MGRWSKRTDDAPVSVEQFELEFEEQVNHWARRRRQGENIDAIMTKARKCTPREVAYLHMKEDRKKLETELKESGW